MPILCINVHYFAWNIYICIILHKHRVCFPLTPTSGIQHFHLIPNCSVCSSIHSPASLSTHSALSLNPKFPQLAPHTFTCLFYIFHVPPNWRSLYSSICVIALPLVFCAPERGCRDVDVCGRCGEGGSQAKEGLVHIHDL